MRAQICVRMDMLKEYEISFFGLKEGLHRFEYKIDKAFFEHYGFDEFLEFCLTRRSSSSIRFFNSAFSCSSCLMYSLSLTPFVYHIIHKSAIAYLDKMKNSSTFIDGT